MEREESLNGIRSGKCAREGPFSPLSGTLLASRAECEGDDTLGGSGPIRQAIGSGAAPPHSPVRPGGARGFARLL